MAREKIIAILVTEVLSAVIWFAFDKAFEFMDWEDYQFTAMMLITVLWKIVLNDLNRMKTAEEILNEILVDVENRPVFFREQDVVDLIAQAQKDAYNQAMDNAAKKAKVKRLMTIYDYPVYCVDKESILKLKK